MTGGAESVEEISTGMGLSIDRRLGRGMLKRRWVSREREGRSHRRLLATMACRDRRQRPMLSPRLLKDSDSRERSGKKVWPIVQPLARGDPTTGR